MEVGQDSVGKFAIVTSSWTGYRLHRIVKMTAVQAVTEEWEAWAVQSWGRPRRIDKKQIKAIYDDENMARSIVSQVNSLHEEMEKKRQILVVECDAAIARVLSGAWTGRE